MPPAPGLSGNTLRQVVHATLGGRRVRVRLSNEFGNDSVIIGGVDIASAATGGGSSITPGTNKELTFGGRRQVTIRTGSAVVSDDVAFDIEPLSNVAVTMFVIGVPAQLTGHPGSRTTSYIVPGDHRSASEMPEAVRAEHWYLLSGIDVQRERGNAVVVLGNSIADGRGSGTDKQNRWPDNLAARLQHDARTPDVGVLNAGIGGNCVLKACLGPAGVERLERDVLTQPGARWLIVSEGVNDIGGAKGVNESASVSLGLINAYQDIIRRARDHGIRVYGATILPFEGSQYGSPEHEAARLRVNEWVRKSGAFDAIIDLDTVMRDPQMPSRLRSDVDGGDHLHPNENGYRVMADAIDLSLFTRSGASQLRLAKLFSDGAVLQRGVRIPVWGWADAGTSVSATFRGVTRRATADSKGRWSMIFPASAAGGPYDLHVESGQDRIDVKNVLIGDVWVASGQSNMELTVSVAAKAAEETQAAHDSSLREFKVPVSWSERPSDELAGGSWAPADPQHVGTFSAVAYSFARELRKSERVPIGIVHSSWGGSAIETWLSAESQGMSEEVAAGGLARERARGDSTRQALIARLAGVPAHDPGMTSAGAPWADPALDETGWQQIKVPALWETQGYDGMDGVAWYRATFTLSAEEAAQGGGAALSLGPIDDDDVTWVNGVEIGRTTGYNVPRHYTVPATALRAGTNVLAVRVVDYQGGGGIYGVADSLRLTIGGSAHPLAGTWKFRVGELSMGLDGQKINKIPTITYNKMIRPILPFPIKGVIWYQGESNADRLEQAFAYRRQLPLLVRSWRAAWRASGSSATFPFFWVQLPNFGQPDATPPASSNWATIRESMTSALSVPNTGQAITIDVGEWGDLHPKNKQDVGKRLALVARRVAYGENVESSGPTYRSHRILGHQVTIEFDHVGSGLTSPSATGDVSGFAIAGADKHFVWASARIEGNHVVVWNDGVPNPVAVRYAWMNAPEGALLFSKSGLPAAPFRTDTW